MTIAPLAAQGPEPPGDSEAATRAGFGERLQRLRAAAGLTQEDLAERSGVSVRSISNLERGLPHVPRRDTLRLLADALRLAPADRAAFVTMARRRPEGAGRPADAPVDTGRQPLEGPGRSLPAPPTPLIGRERELAEARRMIESGVRLLTLTGPGGGGKTRLALELAGTLLPAYADGVYVVDLTPLRDLGLVLPTIARALGMREQGERPLADHLRAHLRERAVLLVLDNVEHLLPAAAEVVALLTWCPRLTVLATSRETLRVRWEHALPVPPLALPDPLAPCAPEALAAVPSVALFAERARAVRPDFTLTADNAPTVAEICLRLDGLPLAIELAAARMGSLPPSGVLARLQRPLALLTGGAQDLPARQQTLRATLDWSYALLDPEERALFRRLSVFAGGWTLEAAERICGAPETGEDDRATREVVELGRDRAPCGSPHAEEVLDLLAALVDQSLVVFDPPRSGAEPEAAPRYRLLETVREYAADQLATDGERDDARRRHAAYFLALAERADAGLRGAGQVAMLARMDREHDNLRAALAWALGAGRHATSLRLAGALGRFWRTRGYLAEGQAWLERALSEDAGAPPGDRAKALVAAATLARDRGDLASVERWCAEGLAIARREGDAAGAAASLLALGGVAADRGEYGAAEGRYRESLAWARRGGHTHEAAAALTNLALALLHRGRLDEAAARADESVALFRRLDDRHAVARTLLNVADIALSRGDLDAARAGLDEALALLRVIGSRVGIVFALAKLGKIAAARGDVEEATASCLESLAYAQQTGHPRAIAECLEASADVAHRRGQHARAARLLGLATERRERDGVPARGDPVAAEHGEATLRRHLGEAAFIAARNEGRLLDLAHARDEIAAILVDGPAEPSECAAGIATIPPR